MTLADLLRRYRTRGFWSRDEIAIAAGVSSQYIQMLETGVRFPSDDTIERLIIAMDLSGREANLFRRTGSERP